MLSRMRTALKFLTCGIVVGLLFAPRSGQETRRELMQWTSSTAKEVVGGIAGGMGASRD